MSNRDMLAQIARDYPRTTIGEAAKAELMGWIRFAAGASFELNCSCGERLGKLRADQTVECNGCGAFTPSPLPVA